MKKLIISIIACLMAATSHAGSILIEGFEYANHDSTKPIGWTCDDDSWLCGYTEKDHNRIPHSGNWYAFTNAEESWMFMPLYLLSSMKYRINCWAVSDGEFQLEFWAGHSARPDAMHTELLSATVGSGVYDKFSNYVEDLLRDCEYIGIRAVASNGANCLTIDDIDIDMVEQYSFEVHETSSTDTVMVPGTQATFHIKVQNTGYDPLQIYMTAYNEFFTDIHYQSNGSTYNNFPTEPNDIVHVAVTATLKPDIEPGTVCWLDIHFSLTCDCGTGLATFWVTPVEATQVAESKRLSINVFPNPATDFVFVEAEDLEHVVLIDASGKALSSVATEGCSVRLDMSHLPAGTYFISAKTRSTSSLVKSILKM